MRRCRRRSTTARAGLLAFRATPRVLLLCVPAPPVLAVRLCFASTPAP
ncbi:hypothetical protein [Streptomyces rapamycinicus]|uniref:Uncharacterized protein n=2 Tax=Streptomyces rapamycinicus TaxID=1226757 RepID=A0A0A0NML9_STRRN|nr:hypothetical protein [Streptomyces rapamycinicus]AGP58406.1 hypothetical protein M271_34985 [Streptomyces rapamycinicus NRRL 5491]MBB4786106.1 hypothetical protein [Streptomyces rapamycinicus]RLV78431.1 hypothetical protein D3C57_108640 [Streptomyces rapamycinicus NRRL 5491]UTO66225.1 hypothetical protein LJB45_30475 [Streptomyces rapamycinicus]UTP34180.1 hypothetical protein LIV37_35605 [Streptomyces rapamycinicus NRRL 5491]